MNESAKTRQIFKRLRFFKLCFSMHTADSMPPSRPAQSSWKAYQTGYFQVIASLRVFTTLPFSIPLASLPSGYCHYLEGTHIRNLKLQDPGLALELYLRAQLHLHYSCSHFSLFCSPAPTHASPAVQLLSLNEYHLHTCLPPKHNSLLPGKAQS